MLTVVQGDKKNQSEQASQIIGYVVAEFYASVQALGVDNLWFQMPLYNKSYVKNFRRWNYNCAFYYYCMIMEAFYKINKSNILHS
jgi:hypothetical protein